MKIKTAKNVSFLCSKTNLEDMPQTNGEIAIWGRSNVGKSSLINALLKQKIAKVSAIPGRTQTVNFFKNQKNRIIVDLPGYGYAKLNKKSIKNISYSLINYIVKRKELLAVFLIIDAKIGPTFLDLEIINFLKENKKRFFLLINKTDKTNQKELQTTIKKIKEAKINNDYIKTSAKKSLNIFILEELIESVFKINL